MVTSPKRIAYIAAWKRRHKQHVREYNRKYMLTYRKTHPEKFYIPKTKRHGEFYGTSGLGRKYELLALKLLQGSKDRNAESFQGKWDIEWSGLKIDVKMRYLASYSGHPAHYRFTTKKHPVADFYLLFCVKKTQKNLDNIEKVIFLPGALFGKSGVAIPPGQHKRTDKYRIKFSKENLSIQ